MSHDHERRSVLKGLLVGAVSATVFARSAVAKVGSGKRVPATGSALPGESDPQAVAAGKEASSAGTSVPRESSSPAGGTSPPRAEDGTSPVSETADARTPSAPKPVPSRASVFRARREKILDEKGRTDPAILAAALGAAVARACGEEKAVDGLRRVFRPVDVVGLKVNCIAGRGLSPRPELVGLLVGWLQDAGVPARNIVVWDRTDRELASAGFEINRGGAGVRTFGTNEDYDWKPREWGPNGSCFSRLLVDDLTALINVGVLKDHELAGVSLGMKNWYGAIHNPNKCHEDGCAPFIPHLASYPLIRDKLRLTVIDALSGQCHGGPARSPKWSWPYKGVLASTDPVALEAVGARILEDRRSEVGLGTLSSEKRAPRWIGEAGKLGLGEADLARIRVEDV